ncbi:MAG: hypothetical protein JXA52_06625 [Planctomycetes bacterium]|nr:hypothetical protein [Planctomycetota bacterium]
MRLDEFFDAVEAHPQLRGVAIDKSGKEGEFAIEHTISKLTTVFPSAAVEKADWEVLEDILTAKREPEVLYHITRVVGYYSRVENWNKSKIGELADRHLGNYSPAEVSA